MVAPDFLEKLGGKPGKVLRIPDADLWPVAAGAMVLTEPTKREKVHGLVVRPRRPEEIARDVGPHRAVIHDDGFIWTVIPKRPAIEALSVDVNPEDLFEIAPRTDLVDSKTLRSPPTWNTAFGLSSASTSASPEPRRPPRMK